MSAIASPGLPATPCSPSSWRQLVRDRCVVLFALSYSSYRSINDAVPEHVRARMYFVEGRLTILTTSRKHDWSVSCLGDMLTFVALGLGLELEAAGSATYRRDDLEAGVEGARAYYLRDHARIMRGPVNIDLATQPPPDVAIEVEVSHSADDALRAWGQIGVPEVWRYDADAQAFFFCHRQPDGTYAVSDRSAQLPPLTAGDVLDQLRQAAERGYSAWYRRLPDWVRDVLAPRLGGEGA